MREMVSFKWLSTQISWITLVLALFTIDLKIYNEMMSLAEKEFGEIFNYN